MYCVTKKFRWKVELNVILYLVWEVRRGEIGPYNQRKAMDTCQKLRKVKKIN